MNKNIRILIFAIVACVTFGCARKPDLAGTWSAGNYSFPEKAIAYLNGTRRLVTEKSLILKKDSTFIKTTPKLILTGKWSILDDQLILIATPEASIISDTTASSSSLHYFNELEEIYTIRKHSLVRHNSGNYCRNANEDGTNRMRKNFKLEILKKSRQVD